jgi:RNA polymerase sigma-70 factor (ECF subfamily)
MKTTMLEETHESHLVEQARRGDQRAFEELFAQSRERLLAMIGGRLSPAVRKHAEPEDVLQDTFIRALHSIERFSWHGAGSFRRWLESIATHILLDVVRRHGRRRVLQLDRDVSGEEEAPSKGLRRRERFERLRDSLETLRPDHQTVLKLSRLEGLPIKEIATRMGRSESAVKNLLLRATRQLKQTFGDTESLHLGGQHFEDPEDRHGG